MEELIRVLEVTVSSAQSDQNEAVRYIQEYTVRDFNGFLKALSDILYDQNQQVFVRAAAGLQLKNQLTARDEQDRQQRQERWRSLPEETRQYIKDRVFLALGTENFEVRTAPQCVAYIALIELPDQKWPGLIQALTQNILNPQSNLPVKLASLEAIGYICQDIDQSCIQSTDSDHILTAIVIHGMDDRQCDEVKLAATTALLNSLEFTETNFRKQQERDYIIAAVCKAAASPNQKIQLAALQCLVKIMTLYYQYMEVYLVQAVYAITIAAMRNSDDDIALQGIEFWSSVCDEEIQLANEAADAQEMGQQPERLSKQYAQHALRELVPILVELLTRQDDSDDNDDWNPCKSAGVCLMLLANCCGNSVLEPVLPHITTNVLSEDWRRRDAAVMIFGSILDGPDLHMLEPLARDVVPYLIKFMQDPSVQVRDSSAWAIGKLCDVVRGGVLNLPHINELISSLAANLGSEPRVASNVCWAINSLVTAAGDAAREQLGPGLEPDSFVLSPYYVNIIQGLTSITERYTTIRDQEHSLINAAYESLMAVIKAAPNDCYHLVYPTTFNMILHRIQLINDKLEKENLEQEIRAQLHDFLCVLWATLSACIRRMEKDDTIQMSDRIMSLLMKTLTNSHEFPATQEDVFMAATTLLEQVGQHFLRYVELFKIPLIEGLSNTAQPQLIQTVLGLVSDLARNLSDELYPWCDELMHALLTKLKEESFDKNAKAQILVIFGDFALAFGPKFEPWIPMCLDMLQHASQISPVDRNDYELVDYCIKLRESTVEAYAGILQGLKAQDGRPTAGLTQVSPRVPVMIKFLETIANDQDTTSTLLCNCCGLVGDIVEVFGQSVAHLINSDKIKELILKGKRSRSSKTADTANWAHNVIKAMLKNQ